jgi:probable HAF family extracellular repeat protein
MQLDTPPTLPARHGSPHRSRPAVVTASRGTDPSRRRKAAHRWLAFALGAALAAFATAVNAQSYTFNFLNAPGGRFNTGIDINNAGQVVGVAGNTHDMMGVLWRSASAPSQELPGTAPCCTYVITSGGAINNMGQIAGSDTYRAAIWTGTTPALLPSLAGTVQSGANDLNDAGQAVGSTLLVSGPAMTGYTRATLWSGGQAVDLGTLGGTSSSASAINRNGLVVGASQLAGDTVEHATLWNHGVAVDLGASAGASSFASSINDAGLIVGASADRAALWQGSSLTFLGGLGTQAADINNAGQVVGFSFDEFRTDQYHAILWSGSTAIDLNSFLGQAQRDAGWTLGTANAINDHGWITGAAFNTQTYESAAYLLTAIPAVPEPATLSLWLAGLGMLGLASRRRHRNAVLHAAA